MRLYTYHTIHRLTPTTNDNHRPLKRFKIPDHPFFPRQTNEPASKLRPTAKWHSPPTMVVALYVNSRRHQTRPWQPANRRDTVTYWPPCPASPVHTRSDTTGAVVQRCIRAMARLCGRWESGRHPRSLSWGTVAFARDESFAS